MPCLSSTSVAVVFLLYMQEMCHEASAADMQRSHSTRDPMGQTRSLTQGGQDPETCKITSASITIQALP